MNIGQIVVCIVGIILLVWGIYSLKKRREFVKNSLEAKAKVLDYKANLNDTFTCIYEYILPNGKKIIAQDSASSSKSNWCRRNMGKNVTILYNKDKPTEITAKKNEIGIQIGLYIMIIMGLFYIALGLFIIE